MRTLFTQPAYAKLIDLDTARKYPGTTGIQATWRTCARHIVTTCHTCNGIWQLGQLAHPSLGYYPGEPGPLADLERHDPQAATETFALRGTHYAWRCPTCNNDLTDLVELHADICRDRTQMMKARNT